jgi:hypothetical protein
VGSAGVTVNVGTAGVGVRGVTLGTGAAGDGVLVNVGGDTGVGDSMPIDAVAVCPAGNVAAVVGVGVRVR